MLSFFEFFLFLRFIISYFLSDDTILVFEPPQRNSGILGGKFLERGSIKKPDGVNTFIAQVSSVFCFKLGVLLNVIFLILRLFLIGWHLLSFEVIVLYVTAIVEFKILTFCAL